MYSQVSILLTYYTAENDRYRLKPVHRIPGPGEATVFALEVWPI